MTKLTREECIVRNAQRRAQIVAFMNASNAWQTVRDVATGVGVTPKMASNLLYRMEQSGMVLMRKSGMLNVYALKGADGSEPGEPQQTNPAEPKSKRAYSKKVSANVADNVRNIELVIGKMLVLIGRNPESGRLRITLEET